MYSSDPQEVVKDLVSNVSKPETPLNKYSKILDGVVAIKEIIDLVTEVNENCLVITFNRLAYYIFSGRSG